jgi:hypothetical protein
MEMNEDEIRAAVRSTLAGSIRQSMIAGREWRDISNEWKGIVADELTKIIDHLENPHGKVS